MIIKIEKEPVNVYAIGDIHGDFEQIVFKINSQYQLTNSIFILCGDVGMGFNKAGYYKALFTKLNIKLKKLNNYLYAVRGNHDDPEYFKEDNDLKFSNIKLLEDYSIIETSTKTILTVGGAYSIDRMHRIKSRSSSPLYWEKEPFIYDESKLDELNNLYDGQITHVCTHSAPSICFPYTKEGMNHWFLNDSQLYEDLSKERADHSLLLEYLISKNQPVRQWCYGHFHMTHNEYIDKIKFSLLDINQLYDLK